jgi:hypothetical protein
LRKFITPSSKRGKDWIEASKTPST